MPIINNNLKEYYPPDGGEYIIKNGVKNYNINEIWLRKKCKMEPIIVY